MTEMIIGLVAPCAALVQIVGMGVIGYPIMKRSPGGLPAFHRSGFGWWLGVLLAISAVALFFVPNLHNWWYPSTHGASAQRLMLGALTAFIATLAVELGGERLVFGRADSEKRRAANAKYESAPPLWAKDFKATMILVCVIALLEEFVFRAIALGGMWHDWGLQKPVAAGLVALAFGLSYWFYGYRRIVIKIMVGSILVWSAFTGGWLAAALAHILLNIALTYLSFRQKARLRSPARDNTFFSSRATQVGSTLLP